MEKDRFGAERRPKTTYMNQTTMNTVYWTKDKTWSLHSQNIQFNIEWINGSEWRFGGLVKRNSGLFVYIIAFRMEKTLISTQNATFWKKIEYFSLQFSISILEIYGPDTGNLAAISQNTHIFLSNQFLFIFSFSDPFCWSSTRSHSMKKRNKSFFCGWDKKNFLSIIIYLCSVDFIRIDRCSF